jgi:NAD-dependent SIR2 family protein deacetylase
LFDKEYFKKKPEAFYHLARQYLDLDKFKTTSTHHFLKILRLRYKNPKIISENIDYLNKRAPTGIIWDDDKIVTGGATYKINHFVNGTNHGASCATCGIA